MGEGTFVGLDVHARSVIAGLIDGVSGEVRSVRAQSCGTQPAHISLTANRRSATDALS